MAGVDDRVVEMQFDNAQFESKLGETLKGLDRLNQSLDFTNAQRNLDGLSRAGSNFSMGDIGSKIEGVSAKFTALATIGITALSNITNRAVSAGTQLVKSFTTAPIEQGFQNFSTKMTSISTILANTSEKGTKLGDVQKALGDLNTYANATIYDFSQMTQNLGTFTAAGVDLGTAKEAIKGIANVAAISGSNTEQASMAMYQLSQAMAAGRVKLQDWNSVVNAGMGGQVFQKALFTTGVALKQIPNIPVGETFEQWTAKGHSFRDSLQSGWLTTKVLTQTLNSFTGDFTVAQLKAKGYTQQQAEEMAKLGKTGLQAATQIKSVSALMDMLKENAAAGWSQTFSILGGTYDQTVGLFTNIGNALAGIEAKSANARNALLQGWSDLGGRTLLIQGFKNAITALRDVFNTVREVFRELFPPETSKQLVDLTKRFDEFTKRLIPSKKTLDELRDIFGGVFSVLKIGEVIIKDAIGLILSLLKPLDGAGAGFLSLGDRVGLFLQRLEYLLVDQGGIADFFKKLRDGINDVITAIRDVIGWFARIFSGASSGSKSSPLNDVGKAADNARTSLSLLDVIMQRLEQRYHEIANLFQGNNSVFQWLAGIAAIIGSGLATAGQAIHRWFSQLGQTIAASLTPGDFDAAVDTVNVGLLGGILLLIKKFMGVLKQLDITGGMLDSIKGVLNGVKGQLVAMQTELKAKALEEIAIALGVLTASIVVLSLIDSAKLTKAMTAMAVGMGELVATMAAMQHVSGGAMDAAKFTTLAAGMTLMATATLILSASVAVLAHLNWDQLARGLTGVAAMMGIMVATAKLLQGSAVGFIAAGLAMIPLATGLAIMAGVVSLFGHMSWETMGKGLVGLAGSLLVLVATINLMPTATLLAAGLAMIPLAIGITILAGALKLYGLLPWDQIARGLVGLAGSLLIIALAMNLMPVTLPITALGLVGVGIALTIIAGAMRLFGGMSWGEIGKGLASIAGIMLVLALGMTAMTGALPGAVAMVVVSGALVVLTNVLKTLASLKISELIQGLLAIAGVFAVIGLAGLVLEPVIPALLGLGLAMTLLGAGFALFGAGALLVGDAITALAKAGTAGIQALITTINMFLKAIPMFTATLVVSLEKSAGDIANSSQLLLKLLTVLLSQILDTVIKMAPKIANALVAIITSGLALIRKVFPDVAQTIVDLLTVLLKTIANHMPSITQAAVNIIVNFAGTLTKNAQKLVDAAVNLITSFLTAIAHRAKDIAGAGLNILVQLLSGIANNIIKVVDAVGGIVTKFVNSLGGNAIKIVNAGADVLAKFITGIGNDAGKIAGAATAAIVKFINGLSSNAVKILNAAGQAILTFMWGLDTAIKEYEPQIIDLGFQIGKDIIAGAVKGVAKHAGGLLGAIGGVFGKAIDTAKSVTGSKSPSLVFAAIGRDLMRGAANGINGETSAQDSVVTMAENIVKAFQETLSKMPNALDGMEELSPRITPVLDLSKVEARAKGIGSLLSISPITPHVSTAQAGIIATTEDLVGKPADPLAAQVPKQVVFNQTINSPTALSTNDIYKNTNSQIARAKEELNI